ncbi:HAD family hydrolase [Mixta tenebrionis]|uniref:HAD family hydrolase n=1 Tax=Mixta tenebrionis TaxID=2562439 RepID=A0A506VFK8_9GAMM|nr:MULTISPECIES: HAD family hydrolase [Mixta]QHM76090.1 putative phosphatase [Mixta theicola]TPW44617.1 HAD family hydrolase [Mixta tenebrionis]
MDLALFDLDRTLICADSNSLWIRWLVSQGYAPETLIAEEEVLMAQYCQGALPLEIYMQRTLAPLTGMATLTVSGWTRRFIQRDIVPRVYPAARERLAWHHRRGDTIMLISTCGEHLMAPIAQRLGAHGALGVGVEIIADRYSGAPGAAAAWRDGKATRVADWRARQQQQRFQHTWAYGDSVSDLPLLQLADHACAINPDAPLLQEAQQRGWEIARWVK